MKDKQHFEPYDISTILDFKSHAVASLQCIFTYYALLCRSRSLKYQHCSTVLIAIRI